MINMELRTICERMARLEKQRQELADEIKAVKKDAVGKGFDGKLITKTVALLLKPAVRQKQELDQHSLFDTYLSAVGLLPDFAMSDESHDPVTGEITDHNSSGVVASSPLEGREPDAIASAPAAPLSESDAPIIASETAEGEGATLSPSATLSEQDHASPVGADLEAVDAVSPDRSTASLSEDLAIPDFLVRRPPSAAPIERVFP